MLNIKLQQGTLKQTVLAKREFLNLCIPYRYFNRWTIWRICSCNKRCRTLCLYILDIVNINFDSANKIIFLLQEIKLPTETTTADDKINIIRFGYSATMYGDYIAVSDPYAYTDAKTHIDYFSGRVFLFKFDYLY